MLRYFKMQGTTPVQPSLNVATVNFPHRTQPAPHYNLSKCRDIRGMAFSQLVMGCAAMIIGAIISGMTGNDTFYYSTWNSVIAAGVWVGAFLIITGSFGVAASKKQNFCLITTFMIMNIISTLMVVVLIGTSSAGVSLTSNYFHLCPKYSNTYGSYHASSHRLCHHKRTFMALEAVNIAIGFGQFIITIICSGICCGIVCCRSRAPNSTMTQYHTGAIRAPYLHVTAVPAYQPAVGYPSGQIPTYYADTPQVYYQMNNEANQSAVNPSMLSTGQGQNSDEKPPQYDLLP